MYKSCYIESINGRWYIMWPDCTKVWDQGYKTRSWAVRMLNYLVMDYDMTIHHKPDAQAWAKLFIDMTKNMNRDVFRDEDYMVVWFANAMMAMHGHIYKTEIERLRKNQSIIIASFRINMMRLCPDYSPEEFDKDIADIVGEKG